MKTAGRWPWKSASAKECVTTHLPNVTVPKMDGARTSDQRYAVVCKETTCRWAWTNLFKLMTRVYVKSLSSADLGDSSKYPSENLEG